MPSDAPTAGVPALAVDGLVKRYDGRAAVDGLSFTAAAGAVTAVLGPNGAGKTTMLECCTGLRTPDAGSITVLGLDAGAARHQPVLRRRVGVMLQDGGLPLAACAGEVLAHVASLHAEPVDADRLLRRLGLDAQRRTVVRRLSGGERQRLALAVALVGRPALVVLDEPTAGVDPQGRLAVWELVGEVRASGAGVVLTTHAIEEAERVADHVVVVDRGRVVASGTAAALTGGGEVTLRFTGTAGLDVGTLAPALPPGVSAREVGPGAYVVQGDSAPVDPMVIATVASWCATHGVAASTMDVRRRSLEDVFLDLTGRTLR